MFHNVIVRRPSRSLVDGITSAPELGKPDYELALRQHDAYIEALKSCGVEVTVLNELEEYSDSCFVEDVAVLTGNCAVITNPGAPSRNGEKEHIVDAVRKFYSDEKIAYIEAPGTLEGGDVMMVGDHFYVGRSARTNEEGIRQFIAILERFGLTGSEVPLEKVLHLKTGVNYVGDDTFLVAGEFTEREEFKNARRILIPEDEAYSVNCIRVNDKVIVPSGFPKTVEAIRAAGFEVILTDISEYRKLDGGLSCLSLRF